MQQDIATTRSIEGRDGPAFTVGLDVGDRYTHVCVLGGGGEVVRERRVRTTAAALGGALEDLPPARVVLEAGPRSPWLSRLMADLGHEVVVANPRQVALIARSQRKTDRLDAEWLARLGRFDPELLAPIRHRSEQSQHDLAVVRARDALVRTRTLLINHVRGAVKACGAALPSCTAEAFHRKMADHIPSGLRPALLPLVEAVGELTARIAAAGREVEALCEAHPETRALRQVTGVGPITALTFHARLQDRLARLQDGLARLHARLPEDDCDVRTGGDWHSHHSRCARGHALGRIRWGQRRHTDLRARRVASRDPARSLDRSPKHIDHPPPGGFFDVRRTMRARVQVLWRQTPRGASRAPHEVRHERSRQRVVDAAAAAGAVETQARRVEARRA